MIITNTIKIIESRYRETIEKLLISDVRIGIFLSAIKLSDESIGISSTLPSDHSEAHCKKENRDFGEFTPFNIIGKKAMDLLISEKINAAINTLKVAVLNAISSTILKNSDYKILKDTDPLNRVDLNKKKTITLVGAFPSYIHRISETDNKLNVLEFTRETLSQEHRKYYVPAEEFGRVLPDSDIVIITGVTLLNNTFDELIKSINPGAIVIVTGPSSSFIPDALFARGVNMVGGVRISKREMILQLVSEAATGYHLYRYGAEKICLINE
jgi:uncharacterized protein (DUF4213/DUF364 family)